MPRAIDDSNLGAWMIKCNPAVSDLPAAADGRVALVDSWCVRPGYRAEMMAAGQRVVLWVSGDGRRLARGIWGLGWVRGPVREVGPSSLAVPVWVPLLDEPLTVAELRSAGVLDLEVQRVPQGANPSWVSREQLAVLDRLLPAWPRHPADEHRSEAEGYHPG